MNGQHRLLISSRYKLTSALEGSPLRWQLLPECDNQVRRKGDFVSPIFFNSHAGMTWSDKINGPVSFAEETIR